MDVGLDVVMPREFVFLASSKYFQNFGALSRIRDQRLKYLDTQTLNPYGVHRRALRSGITSI